MGERACVDTGRDMATTFCLGPFRRVVARHASNRLLRRDWWVSRVEFQSAEMGDSRHGFNRQLRELSMKNNKSSQKVRNTTVLVSSIVALLAMGVGGPSRALAWGYSQAPTHFSGLLNDYTPTSVNGTAIKGAPYEMHGVWTLDLNQRSTAATFSAAISMQTSEVVNAPPYDPAALHAHTHHISVANGVVHNGPTDWMDMCPTAFSPPVAGGFVVTGSAYVTGNGVNAPFGNPSTVTICILGGTTGAPDTASVKFANFTLTFAAGSPATNHFGLLPIHGVVAECNGLWGDQSRSCNVAVQ